MVTKDVMIDIETLAVDSSALVLSVGAVYFRIPALNDPPEIGDAFIAIPSIVEQLLAGRTVDRGTQLFWKQQPAVASSHWNDPGVAQSKVFDMLVALKTFIPDPKTRVWANGIVFDIGILDSLYRDYKIEQPWAYNSARDARTIFNMLPKRTDRPDPDWVKDLIPHHPLADCKGQIIKLWQHGLITE
jgi:hypothetical protein